MPYCTRCGKEVPPGAAFCPDCGTAQAGPSSPRSETPPPPPSGPSFSSSPGTGPGATEQELRAFVGEKPEYYLPRFAGFSIGGVDTFSLSWHWPAFLCGFWWMLYRRMYLWAVAVFFSHWVPYLNLLAWFAWPMVANWLYYKEAKKKVAEVRAANPGADITAALAAVGGVNRWVWPVAVILTLIGVAIAATLGVLGALFFLGQGGQCGAGGFGNS